MAVSSNSIIHYTKELSSLRGIIREGFKIKYCSERITTRGGQKYERAFPMVCFCDLPLTHSFAHISSYGNYGIGLSKKWARRRGINPVQYVDYNSHVGNALRQALAQVTERKIVDYVIQEDIAYATEDDIVTKEVEIPVYDVDPESPEGNDTRAYIETIIMNTKNYEGELARGGKVVKKNYRFYDEREWRYVPSREEISGNQRILWLNEYEEDKEMYNLPLADFRLTFGIDDISYMIVDTEEEVAPLIATLKERFPDADPEQFCRKIITQQQIREDF